VGRCIEAQALQSMRARHLPSRQRGTRWLRCHMTHGGPRKGAGRPAKAPEERAMSHSIRLLPATLELLGRLCEATGKTQREVVTAALEREARRLKL
jgi:hypothetical protein